MENKSIKKKTILFSSLQNFLWAWCYLCNVSLTTALQITTIAGTGLAAGSNGGTATTTSLNSPISCVSDLIGNSFVSERLAHKITLIPSYGGALVTKAGISGQTTLFGDNIQATSSSLNNPHQIHLDVANNLLYIADFNDNRLRVVNLASGLLKTFGRRNFFIQFFLFHRNYFHHNWKWSAQCDGRWRRCLLRHCEWRHGSGERQFEQHLPV